MGGHGNEGTQFPCGVNNIRFYTEVYLDSCSAWGDVICPHERATTHFEGVKAGLFAGNVPLCKRHNMCADAFRSWRDPACKWFENYTETLPQLLGQNQTSQRLTGMAVHGSFTQFVAHALGDNGMYDEDFCAAKRIFIGWSR